MDLSEKVVYGALAVFVATVIAMFTLYSEAIPFLEEIDNRTISSIEHIHPSEDGEPKVIVFHESGTFTIVNFSYLEDIQEDYSIILRDIRGSFEFKSINFWFMISLIVCILSIIIMFICLAIHAYY